MSVDNSQSTAFPPIGNHGSISSCVAWATTYYQFTYETNLALGRIDSSGDNTVIFSPKWTYNMINGGVDTGSSWAEAYALELKNGAATWADFAYDNNFLTWDMYPSHWDKAINYRTQSWGSIFNSNVDTWINDIKTQLTNGHVMVIGTYVGSWVTAQVGNDPTTAEDDAFTGQYIATYEKNTNQASHAMTIVGYNDNIWCDLNGNGVVNTGEKGAFKIANSWGNYWNAGFVWVTYDALRSVSAVPANGTWPTSNRANSGIFGSVYTLTVSPSAYVPTMKAEITLNQLKRDQVAVTLGFGPTTDTTPTSTWDSKALYYSGGDYAFDGTTTAVDGTFVFDFSDLDKSAAGTNRWFIGVTDSTSGAVTTIKSFKLYQGDNLVATANSLPKTVDNGQVYVWVDYAMNTTPKVTNYIGAGNIAINSARLNGEITNTGGENPTVHIYWGTTDGGTTTGSWGHDINLGTMPVGTFYADISSLTGGTKYYYRCYATNSAGGSWAVNTASFTTPTTTSKKLIGVDAGAATTGTYPGNYLFLYRFQAVGTGNVVTFKIETADSGNVKVAIYGDNAGEPGTLLSAVNTSTAVVAGWNDITINATPVVTGNYYWLAYISDGNIGYYQSSAVTLRYKPTTYSSFTFPGTAGTGFTLTTGVGLLAGWGTQ